MCFLHSPILIYSSKFNNNSSWCISVVENDSLNFISKICPLIISNGLSAHKAGFFLLKYYPLFQQLRKLVLEIIHRIPTNEHLRPHTKNILSVMFRFLEVQVLFSWKKEFYFFTSFRCGIMCICVSLLLVVDFCVLVDI